MDGILKFYIPVITSHPFGERESLKQVHAVYCDEKDTDRLTVEFVKKNHALPIVRATWTARPVEVSLNFVSKK